MIKSAFGLHDEVLEQLNENDRSYVLLNIDTEGHSARIMTRENKDDLPVYPRHSVLKEQLDNCCRLYGVDRKGLQPGKEEHYIKFAKRVQEIFFDELSNLLRGFNPALQKDQEHCIESFREKVLEETDARGAKRSEREFLKELLECQCIACLYDEATQGRQGNYARIQAMSISGKSPPIELLRITLYSTPTIVLGRLSRMVEAAKIPPEKEDEKRADSEIPLREKFDWGREIAKMRMTSALVQRSSELRASIRLRSCRLPHSRNTSSGMVRSSDSSGPGESFCTPRRFTRDLGDIVLNMEEVKDTNPYNCSVIRGTVDGTDKKSPKVVETEKSHRKGTLFYGRKGILAFLKEFMSNDKRRIKKYGVADEERAILEYLRNSLAKTLTSSGEGQRGDMRREEDDDNRSVHSEGGSPSSPKPVEMVSVLVDSLIDKFSRVTSFVARDPPFMLFSSSSCLQFYLYLAFFYSRSEREPLAAFKVLISAVVTLAIGVSRRLQVPPGLPHLSGLFPDLLVQGYR